MKVRQQYSQAVLEKIARIIGPQFSIKKIASVFSEAGISTDIELLTKWRMILDAFNKTSGPDAVLDVIAKFCHPLNFHKSTRVNREHFIKELNKILTLDNLAIVYSTKNATVQPIKKTHLKKTGSVLETTELNEASEKLQDEIEIAYEKFGPYIHEEDGVTQEDIWELEDIKKIIVNRSEVLRLREYHQALIDVVETFCQNLEKPTVELNKAYIFLVKKTSDIIYSLRLNYYELRPYQPFKDLYSAEMEWTGSDNKLDLYQNKKLSWDAVRPSLHKTHSDIVKICTIAEEDSKMTDDQKRLEEIVRLVAKARAEKASKTDLQKNTVKENNTLSSFKNVTFKNEDLYFEKHRVPFIKHRIGKQIVGFIIQKEPNEKIDWSEIYDGTIGYDSTVNMPKKDSGWRKIRDASEEINNKVIKELSLKSNEKFIAWDKNCFWRTI